VLKAAGGWPRSPRGARRRRRHARRARVSGLGALRFRSAPPIASLTFEPSGAARLL